MWKRFKMLVFLLLVFCLDSICPIAVQSDKALIAVGNFTLDGQRYNVAEFDFRTSS